ncbi:MAG: class I tRNA ligase family protein, partial [Candidatus Omnitrophica bacterium]|nr:class I tRNA ligase family protein [Candidatus Omnitrophota bacterium]
FSAFGWPDEQSTEDRGQKSEIRNQRTDLEYFYPTSALVTAPEIIFFWVARMIMAGMKFMDAIPFHDVYIHGTVRDDTGKKMSKSLGNTIDPLETIEEFGADVLRFSIVFITATGQDVFLSKQKFIIGRNFANKIWNASRYILQSTVHSQQSTVDRGQKTKSSWQETENLELKERWILSRLNQTIKEINRCLQDYRFQEAEEKIYEFFWHQFCDWYIELAKPVQASSSKLQAPSQKAENLQPATCSLITQTVLYHILETSMRLLHPFMPFISEEIWQKIQATGQKNLKLETCSLQPESLIIADWPVANEELINKKVEQDMGLLVEVIKTVRNLCAELNIKDFKKSKLILIHFPKRLKSYLHYISRLTRIKNIKCQSKKPQKAISAVVEGSELHLVFENTNLCGERKRLQEKVEGLRREKERISNRLGNKEFLNKAPKEIVEKNRIRGKEINAEQIRLKNIISQL